MNEPTPTFTHPKRNEEAEFLTEDEMDIVDKSLKPRFYFDEMMKGMGIDAKRSFSEMMFDYEKNIKPYNG